MRQPTDRVPESQPKQQPETGLLLIGGNGPSAELLAPYLAGIDAVVAADSGFDLARHLQITPDLVVGDMDSVQQVAALEAMPAERVRRSPTDKDLTDTEIGLETLVANGCRRVLIAGGGGGRFDHQLAVLQLFERSVVPWLWLTDCARMQALSGRQLLHGGVGATVSFFPLTAQVTELASCGLRWPLTGLCLRRGYASVSNQVEADPFQVTVGHGRMLMVLEVGLTHSAAADAGTA